MRNPVNLELNLCGRATTPRGDGKKIGRSVTMAVDAASMRCEITSVSLCEYIYVAACRGMPRGGRRAV